jgi:hypothetical protein
MKKAIMAAAAVACAVAGPAYAGTQIVAVSDPTPNGAFTGTYTYKCPTATDPNATCTGTQKGYVGVYSDGVVACNGNTSYKNPQDGSALQGYIWVGPGEASSNPTAAAPGNVVGAGDNNHDSASQPTSSAPCPN